MMVPYRLVISPEFAAGLAGIHDAITRHSPANAAGVATRIMDAVGLLKGVPHRAALLSEPPGLKHPVRSVAVPPYVVYFRAVDDDKVVRVLRVRHGARLPPTRFD